jgi:ribosomal protein RSM22 (predicted rRNA methylase)
MSLPPALRAAVARWQSLHGRGSRRAGVRGLAQTYRAGGASRGIDFAAYLVARLPATYAAVSAVFRELRRRRPDFAPASLLDVGAGPGTASWAAVGHWPGIARFVFLDNAPDFLALAAELAASGEMALAGAERVLAPLAAMPDRLDADLVVAAYALAELPLETIAAAADRLWRASRAMLVIVEPGTPHGFARIRAARDRLLSRGAVPVAPCPHALRCPLADGDWCHFAVRLARQREHMHAKDARLPFEDEKFAYLVLARSGAPSGGGRILSPPHHGKAGAVLRLCMQGSVVSRRIARRDGALYKRVKKLGWGDLIGPDWEDGT